MRRKAAVALLAVLFACTSAGYIPPPPLKPKTADLQWFYEALKGSDQLEILEGLPHHFWESTERDIELSKHTTVTIAKQAFYTQRLSVDNQVRAKLTSAFLNQNLFIAHKPDDLASFKQCGGFHADYGLQWLKENKPVAAALVCFGCGEILIVNDKMDFLADMTEDGGPFLARILKPLRGLRPPFQHQQRLNEIKAQLPQPIKIEKIEIQP